MRTVIEIDIDTEKFHYELKLAEVLSDVVSSVCFAHRANKNGMELPHIIRDRKGNTIGVMKDGHSSKQEEE